MCGGNEAAIEKVLSFGRELKLMSIRLRQQFGKNEANKKALQVCFPDISFNQKLPVLNENYKKCKFLDFLKCIIP